MPEQKKYIDAEELVNWIDSVLARGEQRLYHIEIITLQAVRDWVLRMKSADVHQVKRGQWKHYGDKDWLRDDGQPVFILCSECNNFVLNNASSNWNFCPNCGADMRDCKPEHD